MSKFSENKKLRYGTSATVITVIVIVALVILNVIITALGTTFGWYTDISAQNYYRVSDAFKKEFEGLTKSDGKTTNFNVVLMMDEDRFSTYNYQTLLVYNTIREIAKLYPNVNLKAINSTAHPELVEQYKFTYGDTITITDVVVEAADENFEPLSAASNKKYGINAFFTYDTSGNLYGYNAEARFLSAFAQMLGKDENQPVAFYLQGHGEPALDTVEKTWVEVLENSGYRVQEINLRSGDEEFSDYYDIAKAGDYNNCLLLINDPKFDLQVPAASDKDLVNEVKKIREFFGTGYGNIIVTVSSTTPDLPALSELLSEFGLGYGGAISDSRHSIASSDASKITADYSRMSDGMAASLKNELFGSRSTTVATVFESPANVYVKDKNSGASDTIHGYNGAYGAYALMYPYSSATVVDRDGYDEAFIGMYYSTWDLNDENNTRSYAIVIGSTEFLSQSYANTCMNKTIMTWLLSQIYDEMISFEGINFIQFTNGKALEVTGSAATAWTVTTIVVVPVIAAVIGTVVWIRRRHS